MPGKPEVCLSRHGPGGRICPAEPVTGFHLQACSKSAVFIGSGALRALTKHLCYPGRAGPAGLCGCVPSPEPESVPGCCLGPPCRGLSSDSEGDSGRRENVWRQRGHALDVEIKHNRPTSADRLSPSRGPWRQRPLTEFIRPSRQPPAGVFIPGLQRRKRGDSPDHTGLERRHGGVPMAWSGPSPPASGSQPPWASLSLLRQRGRNPKPHLVAMLWW